MTRLGLTLVSTILSLGGAGLGCAHPAPRGPIATTAAGIAPPADRCGDAAAPYLAELCAMGEPSLSVSGPEAYRFVWTRHLRNPVAVRVTRTGRDVAVVSIEGDALAPAKKRHHEFVAAAEVLTTLLGHLETADFWNLAGDPGADERGLDGADWVIEGRRAGLYHSVVRWEPKPGPFRAACEDFIKVAGLSFPEELR